MVHAFTDAFNAGDMDALIECCDPDVEFESTFAAVGGATYRGHDGMRQWHRDLSETWGDEIRSELGALFDLGEDVLVFTDLVGRGQQSGVEVELPAAMTIKLRNGRLVHFKGYGHREDAIRDLGLSEEDLKASSP